MEKVLFHGSERIVSPPIFGEGNPRNDYGLGFYCTESLALAREWASSETADGFANQYILDLDGLSVLNLNGPGFNILNWLAVLLENRIFDLRTPVAVQGKRYLLENFLPEYASYDILVGYRADDSYFSFSKAFLENGISLEQLRRAMQLGNLGEQVVLKSQKAFGRIQFVKTESVESSLYYPQKRLRDQNARKEYFRMLEETPVTGEHFLVNIMGEKWLNNDPRLF